METYEQIFERMKEAYSAASGAAPDTMSDTGLRLGAAAAEVYRLGKEVQWLRTQAFPHTAWGEYLDLHGAQRGVIRTPAAKAQGSLSFSRYLPLSFDLVIPAGTVCAASGDTAVEYETTEDAVLTAGELTVEAPAAAVTPGTAGNAAAGYINTMVTPVTGIQYVVNTAAFSGGAEQEEDEAYRKRVLSAYSRIDNGGNSGYYRRLALEQPGILSAQAVPRENGIGTVTVYVWGDGAAPDEAAIENVRAVLQQEKEIGVDVTVAAAEARAVNLTLRLKMTTGADFASASELVRRALARHFAAMEVGDAMYLADISRTVLSAAPVQRLEYPTTMRDVAAAVGKVPVLGTVTLSELA